MAFPLRVIFGIQNQQTFTPNINNVTIRVGSNSIFSSQRNQESIRAKWRLFEYTVITGSAFNFTASQPCYKLI